MIYIFRMFVVSCLWLGLLIECQIRTRLDQGVVAFQYIQTTHSLIISLRLQQQKTQRRDNKSLFLAHFTPRADYATVGGAREGGRAVKSLVGKIHLLDTK